MGRAFWVAGTLLWCLYEIWLLCNRTRVKLDSTIKWIAASLRRLSSFMAVNAMVKTKHCFRVRNWLFWWPSYGTCFKLGRGFTNKSKWWLMHLRVVLVVHSILKCLSTARSNSAAELTLVEEQWVLDVTFIKFWTPLQKRGKICLLL